MTYPELQRLRDEIITRIKAKTNSAEDIGSATAVLIDVLSRLSLIGLEMEASVARVGHLGRRLTAALDKGLEECWDINAEDN